MKKATHLFILITVILGCKGQTESQSDKRFSTGGEFNYNIQLAHFETGQVEIKGECTKDTFTDEFEKFDWKGQLAQANEELSVSPTIAVIHNKSKKEMGISVVGNSPDDYGFWIFYGKAGAMNSIEVYNEKSVIPYIESFFTRDFNKLDMEFDK